MLIYIYSEKPQSCPIHRHQAPCQRRYFIILQTNSVVKQTQREEESYGYTQAHLSTFRATNAPIHKHRLLAQVQDAAKCLRQCHPSVCGLRVQSDVVVAEYYLLRRHEIDN